MPDTVRNNSRLALALVGLRCSGKTTVGRALAPLLGRRFVDLDDELADRAGHVSAGAALEVLGLERFRAHEREALAAVLAADEAIVLATGGGVVEDERNLALLGARATCVWLRASATVLLARSAADPALRPPLVTGADDDPRAEIEVLAARRDRLYRGVAAVEVVTDELDVAAVAAEIAERVG